MARAVTVVSAYERAFAVAPRVAAGEEVTFKAHDAKHPGWFSGTDVRGVDGYFPAAWFNFSSDAARPVARRDYDAMELSVTAGQRVTVRETVGNWARAAAADGRVGWVPVGCLGDFRGRVVGRG